MTNLEDTNEVLMDEIAKAIEIHLGQEVGFILGCKQAWREVISSPCKKTNEKKKKKNLSCIKLKNGNSNINGVVFFEKQFYLDQSK